MKLRMGFVSNSSSSSFICVLFGMKEKYNTDKDYKLLVNSFIGKPVNKSYVLDNYGMDEEEFNENFKDENKFMNKINYEKDLFIFMDAPWDSSELMDEVENDKMIIKYID